MQIRTRGGQLADYSDDQGPISAPKSSNPGALGRAVAEGIAEFVPGASFVASVLRVTHPPKTDRDREAWEQAISQRTNENAAKLGRHESLLSPKTEMLAGITPTLVSVLAKACPNGLAEAFIDLDEIIRLLSNAGEGAVNDAVQDLVVRGLLEERVYASSVRPTQLFYEQFDSKVMEWGSQGTRQDAAIIAALMLNHDNGHTPDIFQITGWPLRRFNPGLAHLKNAHLELPWRDQFHFDHPTSGLVIGAREKAALRRFILSVDQHP